jgi:hypothetical protein
MPFVTLPDGQGVRSEDVSAIKVEQFFGSTWYVYVELKNHPRVTITAGDEATARKMAGEITTGLQRADKSKS